MLSLSVNINNPVSHRLFVIIHMIRAHQVKKIFTKLHKNLGTCSWGTNQEKSKISFTFMHAVAKYWQFYKQFLSGAPLYKFCSYTICTMCATGGSHALSGVDHTQ